MALSMMMAGTGLGISSDYGLYRWHAHSFNPSCDPDYNTWNPWYEPWQGFSIYGSTSNFNLSGFRYGNEAILAAVQFYSDVADSGTIYMYWYDPNMNLIFTFSCPFWMGSDWWYAAWSGQGVKAGYASEIWKNGTYTIYYVIQGNYNTLSGYLYPVVSNHPGGVYTGAKRGYIWVEGEELAFASQQGYKILIHHDGSGSYVGSSHAGHIWLETPGKITYVDHYGYKRNTKMGDEYGYPGVYSEIPGTPGIAYKGYIWVCNDFNDTYLVIVSTDGKKYRIGTGYVYVGGDYQ